MQKFWFSLWLIDMLIWVVNLSSTQPHNPAIAGSITIGAAIYLLFIQEPSKLKALFNPNPTPEPISTNDLPEVFIVLDLETTGLSAKSNRILEIGAIKASKTADTMPKYQTLITPKRAISEKITEITGITTSMAKQHGKPIEVAIPELLTFIDDKPIVAFNADFDIGFLSATIHRLGIKHPRIEYHCALELAREAWPNMPNHRLATLAKHLGLDATGNHRALKDAELALKVYILATDQLEKNTHN